MEFQQINTNAQLRIYQPAFWKGCDGYLRVSNAKPEYQSRGKIIITYSIPRMIEILNEVRQQYGQSVLNIDLESSSRRSKKRYISQLIEATLINNGSLITLYPLTN